MHEVFEEKSHNDHSEYTRDQKRNILEPTPRSSSPGVLFIPDPSSPTPRRIDLQNIPNKIYTKTPQNRYPYSHSLTAYTMPSNHAATPPLDPTFLTYTPQLADAYASGRSTYPPALYSHILAHHALTGGRFLLLLDVGCGPGNAVRDLATSFADAVGVDGSVEMVNVARREGGVAGSGRRIRFEVGEAERGLDGVVGEGSVDLVVAAMAVCGLLSYIFRCWALL